MIRHLIHNFILQQENCVAWLVSVPVHTNLPKFFFFFKKAIQEINKMHLYYSEWTNTELILDTCISAPICTTMP